jgi:lipoyl(octanoyl) transferase
VAPTDSWSTPELTGPVPTKPKFKQQLGSFESLEISRDRAERKRLVILEDFTTTDKNATTEAIPASTAVNSDRDPTVSRTVPFPEVWKIQQQYWQQHSDRQAAGCSSSFLGNRSSLYAPSLKGDYWKLQERREPVLGVDRVLFVVHDPVYTLGTGSDPAYILKEAGACSINSTTAIPVVRMDRGGEVTYHGPGQLVAYPVLDLRSYKQDIHWYVRALEETVIVALRAFFETERDGEPTVPAAVPYRDDETTGVWIENHKVAAVGVKCRRWVTMHGVAVNVEPQSLEGFSGIVPCGLEGRMVGCVSQFAGRHVGVSEFAPYLRSALEQVFCIRLVDTNMAL